MSNPLQGTTSWHITPNLRIGIAVALAADRAEVVVIGGRIVRRNTGPYHPAAPMLVCDVRQSVRTPARRTAWSWRGMFRCVRVIAPSSDARISPSARLGDIVPKLEVTVPPGADLLRRDFRIHRGKQLVSERRPRSTSPTVFKRSRELHTILSTGGGLAARSKRLAEHRLTIVAELP
jgi:hypothetical protein